MDTEFYEHLPEFFPHTDARSWFAGNAPHAETTAFRNSSLQGAYFILAARALGLDTGPMSGFDNAAVDAAFLDRKSVVSGKSVSVRVVLGGRRILKTKNKKHSKHIQQERKIITT